MEETVALGVHTVEVTLVADQGGGNALMPVQQGQVEGDVPLIVTLIESMGKLKGGNIGSHYS